MAEDRYLEINLYEDIGYVSEQMAKPSFEAYITIEGVFQGIERVSGDRVPEIFSILFEKAAGRCLYVRISLRRRAAAWDEAALLVCGSVIMGAQGVVGDEELSGASVLEKIVNGINTGAYTAAILELTELPPDFLEKRLGVKVSKPAMEQKPVHRGETGLGEITTVKPRAPEKPAPPSPVAEAVEEKPGPGEVKPSSTIPVQTGFEKTRPLPLEEARKFYPRVPKPVPRRGVVIEEKKEEAVAEQRPVELQRVLEIEKPIMEISGKVTEISRSENIGFSTVRIRGENSLLLVEVMVTKVGLLKKRDRMMKVATALADALETILSTKYRDTGIKNIQVIVRHGWDAVKVTRKL